MPFYEKKGRLSIIGRKRMQMHLHLTASTPVMDTILTLLKVQEGLFVVVYLTVVYTPDVAYTHGATVLHQVSLSINAQLLL